MAVYTFLNTYHADTDMVDDGDAVNAAITNPQTEDVGDNTKYLYERVNAQHVTGGNHFEVVCTGDVNDVKLNVEANAGDAAGVKIQTWENAAGAVSASISSDGTIEATGYLNSCGALAVDPCDFQPATDLAGAADYFEINSGNYLREKVADSTAREVISRAINIPLNCRITLLSAYFDRPSNEGQSISVALCHKLWNTTTKTTVVTISDATATTGTQTISSGALTEDVSETGVRPYFLIVELDNGAIAADTNALKLHGCKITYTRIP